MSALEFRSTNGSVWPLDGSSGVTLLEEAEGLFEIPDDLVIDPRVGVDGGVLVNRRQSPRRLVLPFLLVAPSGRVRGLWGQVFAALRAGGTLVYTEGASVRELRHVVLESVDRSWSGHDLGTRRDDLFTVSMLGLDPWWYGEMDLTEIDLAAIDGTPWDPPVSWAPDLPWNGGDAEAITVAGDTGAAPVFTITGPVEEVIVARSGLAWAWQTELASGEGGTVDCRPGRRGPRLGSDIVSGVGTLGDVRWQLLTEQSRLFNLEPGDNTLAIGVTGASAGATLTVGVEPRYLIP